MRRKKAADAAHIAEAAEWRLIGLLLERPRGGWHEEVAALGREVADAALRAAAAAACDATEGAYLRLLGPGGAVSPREVTYRAFEDPGHVLAEIAGFYQAFAFQPRAEEPIDHIAVEAGFVGYLLLKEAFAVTAGDREAAATTAAARARFIATHLAPLAAPFARRLDAVDASYLAQCARLIAARVPSSPAAGIAPPDPLDVPDGCGSCPMT